MGVKKISRSKVRELNEKGLTDPEIAEKLNCTKGSIGRIRKELGLKSNWLTSGKVSRKAVGELHSEGMTDPEIARELKVSQGAVWKIRNRELGLEPNYLSRKTIDYGELWKDYMSGMPLDELAEKYGYASVQSIRREIGRIYLERGKNE